MIWVSSWMAFRKKTVEATGDVKNKLDQKIVALEQEQKNVEEKLANLEAEAGEKWKQFKAGVTAAIESSADCASAI